MKISLKQAEKLSIKVNGLLTSEELKSGSKSKLKYAIQRFNVAVQQQVLSIQTEKIQDVNLDLAQEDEKGNLMLKDDKYVYTKENEKLRLQKIKVIENEELEFTPYMFKDIKKIETFDPFIIEELKGKFFDLPKDYEVSFDEEKQEEKS